MQLFQQWLNMGRIIDIFLGQIKSDDLVTVGVDADMQLAPGSAFRRSAFFEKPFAGTAKFQSRAIDDQMQFACSGNWAALNRQPTRSATQRRMIWNRKVDFQQSHDRAVQPFGLAQSQPKHRSQGQRGFDGEVRTMTLAAWGRSRLRFPIRQGFLGKPDRQTSTIAKRRVIVPPIGDPIFWRGIW